MGLFGKDKKNFDSLESLLDALESGSIKIYDLDQEVFQMVIKEIVKLKKQVKKLSQ